MFREVSIESIVDEYPPDGLKTNSGRQMAFWIFHRCVRNDFDSPSFVSIKLSKAKKDEAIEEMIQDIQTYNLYTGYGDECNREQQKRARETSRYFQWEWKRRGNYDAWYVLEGSTIAVIDPINTEKYFEGWFEREPRYC